MKWHWVRPAADFRGFTLQFLLVAILPLSALLLAVAFGSQTLHHEAMRSLVGDRDLKTARAAASALEREIGHLASTITILARDVGDPADFSHLILSPLEIESVFDGGIALYSDDGVLLRGSTDQTDWKRIAPEILDVFQRASAAPTLVVYSRLISSPSVPRPMMFAGIQTSRRQILVGAFTPARLIQDGLGDLAGSQSLAVWVVGPPDATGVEQLLYRSGPFHGDEALSHPGTSEALNGESGINYFQSSEGEHVVAYSPIASIGWGLVIEEAWEDIANPYLMTTQSAPLILVPVFLLALLALGFGARRIVTPLQRLEKLSARLALGNFEAIRQPVGGIEEIRNLQAEMIAMADKLRAAQESLHSYIGAITAGVENERRSLARELHDDTIQALIALNQRIQLFSMHADESEKQSLKELQELVQLSMGNLRRMIRGLRPIYLEDLGLAPSLEMLVKEIEQTARLPIAFASHGQERRLSAQSEMALYRMAQESLNNVVRHAQAQHVWVELSFSEDECSLLIRDDGKGFEVQESPAEFSKRGHFGLLGLQERAELIHARLQIDSMPGKGTSILIGLGLNPGVSERS